MAAVVPWAEQLPSGVWRACWRDVYDRKVHTTTIDPLTGARMSRKAQAIRVASDQELKNRRGEGGGGTRSGTWGEWCPMWLDARRVEPSTAAGDALRIEKYLLPQWGARRLNQIRRTDVQAWANELAATALAAGSIEKIVRLFSASMTAAVEAEGVPLAANPASGVKLPRVAPGHERFLTRSEVEGIAHHLNQPYRLAVLLGAGTGLRWGELAGLHWQRVDLDARMVDVVETWDPTAGRVKTYPKGHNRRGVPIVGWLADALADAHDRADHSGTCGLDHARGGAKCRSGLILTGERGGPLNGKNFGRRQWREACDLAGVGEVRLHDLRHTFASWLVQDGVPLQEVQRLLGHSSIVTTQRYAHLGTSQNDRVLAALA